MRRPLESESIDRLKQIFESARSDLPILRSLEGELERRPSSSARLLRLKVIAARIALQRATTQRGAVGSVQTPVGGPRKELPRHSNTTVRPLRSLLSDLGLNVPDGRPLHTYKLSLESFENFEGLLIDAAKAGRLRNYSREDAALFVLWAADWFRRHYGGGIRKYEDLGRVLGIRFDDQKYWRALVDDGLDWWRRPVIRRASGSHRLLTLALEGGFPARVLEERERGWLVRYLVGLVSVLLALPDVTPEASRDLAWARRTELRETYQEEGFCALAVSFQ